jgi:UDP-N-acetylglucosamine--N-acetylmuramyl-(pentapeptide) pyrophosphoryl-undecaprenol N-acetylglucosamine transferase
MSQARASVSRSGASSLAEIAAVRLPSLLIPYPVAVDDHQLSNARAFEKTGASRVIEQKLATPARFFELLQPLVEDMDMRKKMQEALSRWDAPHAAEIIAQSILKSFGAEVAVENSRGTSNRISVAADAETSRLSLNTACESKREVAA